MDLTPSEGPIWKVNIGSWQAIIRIKKKKKK